MKVIKVSVLTAAVAVSAGVNAYEYVVSGYPPVEQKTVAESSSCAVDFGVASVPSAPFSLESRCKTLMASLAATLRTIPWAGAMLFLR